MKMDLKGAWVIGGRENQGGGDGCFGIISENNERNAEIVWNNGNMEVCTIAGTQICIFDLAPTGVSHEGIMCNACETMPILGTRWKCAGCADYDLCSMCYHGNMHEKSHVFSRIDMTGSNRVNCGTRQMQERKKVYGFYPGAKVKRGRDWEWGAQDGGVGNNGKVVSQYDWKGPFNKKIVHSGISVLWDRQKNENNYRTGFQGKMDLICVTPAFGGYYYRQHLPTLESVVKQIPQKRERKFNVGDIVTINKDVQTLIQLQVDHGGFIKEMMEFIGRVGHVIEICPTGDVLVMFDSEDNPMEDLFAALLKVSIERKKRWVFNALVLKKVEMLAVNDKVRVVNDKELVKLMQKNIGIYKENLELLHGEEGVVLKPFDGKSIQVKFGDRLVVAMSVGAIDKAEDVNREVLVDLLKLFTEALEESVKERETNAKQGAQVGQATAQRVPEVQEKNIVTTVFEGDLAGARIILNDKPYMVNAFKNGKCSLHVALIQGNQDMVDLLIEKGADLSLESDDGDTVLHFAATSNLYSIGRTLIRRRCPVNNKNKAGFTALHIAVQKEHDLFVRMLISEKSDPNIKDPYGNSPIHIACEKGNSSIADILLSSAYPCDITLVNRNGFNALHFAILKGRLEIVQAMLEECPEAVNIEKEDGFTPLHIAVSNGMEDITNFMLSFYKEGGIDIHKKTKSGQSALHLACIEGFLSIVKLLLQHNANINDTTGDEDTTVHLCVKKHLLLCNLPQQLQGWELYPDIQTVKSHFSNQSASGIVIACFLIESGASVDYLNSHGLSCIDICEDNILKKLLLEFGKKHAALTDLKDGAVPTVAQTAAAQREEIEMCPMCNIDNPIEGRFQPCGHALLCYDHAECMKKCSECKALINEVTRVSIERLPNCMICRDVRVNVTFQPCGHQIACYECGKRFKRCLSCDCEIQTKVPICDIPPEEANVLGATANSMDSNEANLCNICFERRNNAAFLCGHRACKTCAYVLRECHMCRVKIERIIMLYDN